MKELVEKASEWILRLASQGHWGNLRYIRSQIAIDEEQVAAARFALEEGLAIAKEAGFSVYEALLRLTRCCLAKNCARHEEARDGARSILDLCETPGFRFAYGAREARRSLN